MFDPLESLVVTTGLLYKHSGPCCLRMWIAVAEGLKFYIDDMKDFSSLKMESDSKCCFAMCDLLSYPLVVCSCTPKYFMSAELGSPSKESHASHHLHSGSPSIVFSAPQSLGVSLAAVSLRISFQNWICALKSVLACLCVLMSMS
ncbi:hypothetical protein FF2_042934 [Malus domestica]